jgi:prepilin-type N-terminal cleavage/methylation domain-containing protein
MRRLMRDTTSPRSQSGMTLIELLIGMVIMSVITAMILVSWFALSSSYSYSATSNMARDNAREAMARLEREIRDAQSVSTTSEAALIRARVRTIVISTTFNVAGNSSPSSTPHLVMYRLYPDGQLWRFYDESGDGVISGVDMSEDGWPANPYDSTERANAEGSRLLLEDVVNDKVPSAGSPTALFRYSYYLPDGTLTQADGSATPPWSVTGANNRRKVVSVQINLLVDLNPAHSPVYTEFQTTAQLRNQR